MAEYSSFFPSDSAVCVSACIAASAECERCCLTSRFPILPCLGRFSRLASALKGDVGLVGRVGVFTLVFVCILIGLFSSSALSSVSWDLSSGKGTVSGLSG